MSKRIFIAVTVLLFTGIFSSQAQKHDAVKAAENFFTVIKAEAQYDQQVKDAIDEQIKKKPQLKSFRPQLEEAINKGMPWKSIQKDLSKIYAKKLTAEDMNNIADFYQTPTGVKLLGKMTDKNVSWQKIQTEPTLLTQMFTTEELTEIMTFAQTPSGTKLIQKMPELKTETEAYLKKKAKSTIETAAKKAIADAVAHAVKK